LAKNNNKFILFHHFTTDAFQFCDLHYLGTLKKMVPMLSDFCDEAILDHSTKSIKAILEVFNLINIRRAFERACF
jgi:hypothetical protein